MQIMERRFILITIVNFKIQIIEIKTLKSIYQESNHKDPS